MKFKRYAMLCTLYHNLFQEKIAFFWIHRPSKIHTHVQYQCPRPQFFLQNDTSYIGIYCLWFCTGPSAFHRQWSQIIWNRNDDEYIERREKNKSKFLPKWNPNIKVFLSIFMFSTTVLRSVFFFHFEISSIVGSFLRNFWQKSWKLLLTQFLRNKLFFVQNWVIKVQFSGCTHLLVTKVHV